MPIKEQKKLKTELLYLDETLLVLNKPAGVLMRPEMPRQSSALDILDEKLEGYLKIVFPCDEDASGLVVFVRDPDSRDYLRTLGDEGKVDRVMLAIVNGYVSEDGEIDLPLRYEPRKNRTRVNRTNGTEALTRYTIRDRLAGNTLLECRPLTRHPDQVRVHLQGIHHPLAVDSTYGGGKEILLSSLKPGYRPSKRRDERPLIDRLTLHMWKISFPHPKTGEMLSFEADIPKDFRATVKQLTSLV